MKKQKKVFGVIGLGRFGFALAQTLAEKGEEVIVIDCNENKVKEATAFCDNAFLAKEITKEVLEGSGMKNCDAVIICIGEKIDTSVLTTLQVIDLGVKHVISKAISLEHGSVLEKLGAQVVYPERDMAVRLAGHLTSSYIMERISLSDEIDISELHITDRTREASVKELALRQKYGINIIAVNHMGTIHIDIEPDTVLRADDIIVVCGKKTQIEALAKIL